MIAPLERLPGNPLVTPAQIPFGRATGAFNPGAVVDTNTGRVVLLVRVYDGETRRSSLALALSSDGRRIDEIRDTPAVIPAASYEEWGVEDARITWLENDGCYAITYTGYSAEGPRVCLITTSSSIVPYPASSASGSARSTTRGRRTACLSWDRDLAPGEARVSAPVRRRSEHASDGCCRFTAQPTSRKATSIRWAGAFSTCRRRRR